MLVRPQWLSQSWVDQVPDLDSLVSHLDNQLLATLVRVDWLGKLDGGGGVGVAVADWDEVGEAAGWVGEEGEDGVGVGRGREGRGGLEGGVGRLLDWGGDTFI